MNIVLLGKLLFGSSFAAISSTFVWWNWDQISGPPYRDIVVYGKVETAITGASSQALTKDLAKGYKCKFDSHLDGQSSNEEFHCSIQKIVFANKQWDFSKPLTSTTTALTAEELTTEHNVLQISFKSNSYEWEQHKTKKIEIISKHDDDKNKKFSTTTLFAVSGDQQFIKPTDFIGQADKASTSGNTLSDYKCSWKPTPSTEGLQDCKIFPFVDNDGNTNQKQDAKISDLAFKQTDTVASSTKMSHYYLIKFTSPYDSKYLESFDFEGAEIIYLKDGSDDKVTFKKLSAVTVVEDQLLILKQHLK